MRAVDIIAAKRDGQQLTEEQINWFIDTYTAGDLPDYQAAAFLMAVYLNGMSREETHNLTMALINSGDRVDLSAITDYAVDKHSSGGVGDKTTLVVLPLVAAMGVPVAKMSGRGLGFTGGTLDKMESIGGYNVNLSAQQFREQAQRLGLVLAGQTGDLAPADGKLYALRDVTATVSSLPLIASSIMSKKIAGGAQGIVLDVKAGRGAFMQTVEAARELAQIMVDIGKDSGRDVIALISDMNQPLGSAVGNALELEEAIETLNGGGPEDFKAHCLEVAAHMMTLAGRGETWTDHDRVRKQLAETLASGSAFTKFREMVQAQGGDVGMIDDTALLPRAPVEHIVRSDRAGYISVLAADTIGIAAMQLGAGRERKEDPVNHAVGLKVHVHVGDEITPESPLITIHADSEEQVEPVVNALKMGIEYSESPLEPLPLFYDFIRSDEG
ncbi:MAG: thymidine phosphorylase [Chloroflexota bacterium]